MSIKKGFWLLGVGINILVGVAAVVLLPQPSGQMSDFQKWQYQSSAKLSQSKLENIKT
ncbi:hypothetical protein LIS44_13825 [Acinetobacter haemolyticus]|nr:hypothetical protein LIS44_13825 [Acinetobacter haemolyticus]